MSVPSQPAGAPASVRAQALVPIERSEPPLPHSPELESDARSVDAAPACPICGSPNPASYRYCAVCGGTISKPPTHRPSPLASQSQPRLPVIAAPAEPIPPPVLAHTTTNTAPLVLQPPTPAAAPPTAAPPTLAQSVPAPQPSQPRTVPIPTPSSNGDAAQLAGDVIAIGQVVQIAEPAQPRPTVFACARCQGQNDGLARFCKYCGAPLPHHPANAAGVQASPAPPPVAPIPSPAQISVPSAPAGAGATRVTSEKTGPHPLVRASEAASRGIQPSAHASARPALALHPSTQPPTPADAHALGVPPQLLGLHPPAQDTVQTRAPEESAQATEPAPPPTEARGGSNGPSLPNPALPSREAIAARQRHVPGISGKSLRNAKLVVVVEDGSDGKSFDLKGPVVVVGRTEGDVILFDDPYVSPQHARLVERDGKWLIQDLHSTNGVYMRLRGRHPVESGDLILLGSQVLQFQLVSDEERQLGPASQHGTRVFGSKPVTRLARLDQRTVSGLVGDVYYVHRDETIMGRETGDIVFTGDAFLSRRHAAIRRDPVTSRFHIEDLDSSNGTYVAIGRETVLDTGDRVRIGQHLFRFETGS